MPERQKFDVNANVTISPWSNIVWKLCTFIALAVSLWAVWGNSNSIKDDNKLDARFAASDERQVEAIRTILCLAQRQVLTSKQRTAEEKRIAVGFYQEALRLVHAPPCDPFPATPGG